MSNEAISHKRSLQNPYSTALFGIWTISLAISVVLFLGGNAAPGAFVNAMLFAAVFFLLAAMALVGWLLLEGMQWREPLG